MVKKEGPNAAGVAERRRMGALERGLGMAIHGLCDPSSGEVQELHRLHDGGSLLANRLHRRIEPARIQRGSEFGQGRVWETA